MLVIALKAGEFAQIGRDTIVRIVRVGPAGEVRLGIEAPQSTRISRNLPEEQHLELQAEREARHAT